MRSPDSPVHEKAALMRARFDEEFSHPPESEDRRREPLLAIRAGNRSYAIRLRDISGLAPLRGEVVRVPSSAPALLGITGLRGEVIPVFSLARLLGLASSGDHARWAVTAGNGRDAMAIAFSRFDGYLRAKADEIFDAADGPQRSHIAQSVRHDGVLLGIIEIAALAREIRERGQAHQSGEIGA